MRVIPERSRSITSAIAAASIRRWPTRVEEEELFRRGDVNGDRRVNLADAVTLLNHLFVASSPLDCPDAGDLDDSGTILLTDPVYLLNYAFGEDSPPPAAPFPDCGADGAPDSLAACAGQTCD